MIREPTVLILGAGASAPYDFPSGRGLLFEICNDRWGKVKQHSLKRGFLEHEIDSFLKELGLSGQPSVDAFLENRPEYMDMGKIAIAASLIPYEVPANLVRNAQKVEWYEYLFNQMGARRDEFPSNKLSIVTFNYDRSLEYFLVTTLRSSYGASDEEVVGLLKSIPIVHVYGQLGLPHYLSENGRAYDPKVTWQAIDKCVAEIKIIPELADETEELKQAHKLISEAKILCFLGFGYHPTNVSRLRVNEKFRGGRLLGSVYEMGDDEIRRARRLLAKGGSIILGKPDEDALTFIRNHPVFT